MKKRIRRYLETNYTVLVLDASSLTYINKVNEIVSKLYIWKDLMDVFGIEGKDLKDIIDKWYEDNEVRLHNTFVDAIYEVSQRVGAVVESSYIADTFKEDILEIIGRKFTIKDDTYVYKHIS